MRRFLGLSLALALVFSSAIAEAADVILNEYNGVSSDKMLDGGGGADSFFGKIEGNGGNWFELVVVSDHVDMRGWQLVWNEDETVDGDVTATGTITLSDHSAWSDLRAGSILTFIETQNAGFPESNFDTSTDLSYDPAADDWWINVATQQEQARGADGVVSTTTNDGAPGDFSVGKDDWTLLLLNASGETVFGPVGEGAEWNGGGVGSEEAGALEGPQSTAEMNVTLESWTSITPQSDLYDDTGGSTFGAPNADFNNETLVFTPVQEFDVLRALVLGETGSGDFNNDGVVDASDIDALTQAISDGSDDLLFDVNLDGAIDGTDRNAWVERAKGTFFGDANLDGEFNTADLVSVLGAGLYETGNPATWATGDWDGNGVFNTSDFVAALGGGGYEQGPRAAAAAVPEPNACLLSVLALVALITGRRQR